MFKNVLTAAVALTVTNLAPQTAFAGSFSIDFSKSTYVDRTGSTALWNAAAVRIHAPPAASGQSGNELDFGDESDGEFSDGPAQTGITISGSTITIDTDTKAEFKFSKFTLSTGKTLRVKGSKAIKIRV